MIADGERLRALLGKADHSVLLCAPFIKAPVLSVLFSMVSPSVAIRVVTRWRAMEVAAGVSDLEVFELVAKRASTKLLLFNDLHAKLYLADHEGLAGSANLTASALGWAERSNLELLVPVSKDNPDVARLLTRLDVAMPATFSMRSEIEEQARALVTGSLEEGAEIHGDPAQREVPWLPSCATPDRLYEIYVEPETTTLAEGTRRDGVGDIRDLDFPPGLTQREFAAAARETLRVMPEFRSVLDRLPAGLTDVGGTDYVTTVRPTFNESEARKQWAIVRDWIQVFFGDEFEVAPESFVVRPKRPGR